MNEIGRRRFLESVVLMGPAALALSRALPVEADLPTQGPAVEVVRYATVVETRYTPAGVRYLAAVARPVDPL